VTAEGWIGRRPKERGFFDLGENISMLTSPKIKPGEADKFVNEEEGIELEGRSEDPMEGRSSDACLVAGSTFSLPG